MGENIVKTKRSSSWIDNRMIVSSGNHERRKPPKKTAHSLDYVSIIIIKGDVIMQGLKLSMEI